MRTFNLRLVLWLAGIFLVVAVIVHFVHGYMVEKNAIVYLKLAKEQDAKFRDELADPPDRAEAAENAVKNYKRYLAFCPWETRVRAEYGKLLLAVGAQSQAYFTFKRVLREDPRADDSDPVAFRKMQDDIRRLQVKLALQFRQYPDAKEQLEVLLEKYEKDGELLEQRGWAQVMNADPNADAVESFTAAIASAPDRLTAYMYLADLYRGRMKEPAKAYDEVLVDMVTANPKNAEAYLYRAQFCLRDPDPDRQRRDVLLDQAEKDCAAAMALRAGYADAMALAATCAQRREKFAEAEKLLRDSIQADAKVPVPQRYLSLANVELQMAKAGEAQIQHEEAIKVLREGIAAVKDKSRDFDLRWQLAALLITRPSSDPASAEGVEEARKIREELRDEKKDSPSDLAAIAYLDALQLRRDQKWFEARKLLEQNRAKLADRGDLQLRADQMLLECYSRLGDLDLRLSTARGVLDENPVNMQARQAYADALVAVGRLPEAIKEYEEVLGPEKDKAPIELFKQYFLLRFAIAARQSEKSKPKWSELTAMLDAKQDQLKDDPWLVRMRVEVAVKEGKKQEAREILQTAKDGAMADEQSIWLTLIGLDQEDGNLEAAAQLVTEMEQKFEDSVNLRMAKARLLMRQKGKEGLPELAKFVEGSEKFTDAERTQLYSQLAGLCLVEADTALCLQYGQQAAQYSPRNIPIRMFLLQVARNAKDVERARQMAEEITKIEQGGPVSLYADAVYDLTRFLASDKKDAAALSAAHIKLLGAQQKRPNWMQIPLLLGAIAEEEKDLGTALVQFQRAIELGNRDLDVIGRAASLLFELGRIEDAEAVIGKLGEQRATPGAGLAALASRISFYGDDLEQAMEMAQIPIKLGSKNVTDYVWMGQLHAAGGDVQKAREVVQQAIEVDKQDGVAWMTLVQLLVSASNKARMAAEKAKTDGNAADAAAKEQEAQTLLEEAKQYTAEAEGQVAEDQRLQTMAQCLRLLNRRDEALTRFEAALKATPDSPVLMEAAARFYFAEPQLWDKARPILEQFVNGGVKVESGTLTWARQALAQISVNAATYAGFQQAMQLVDANLKTNPTSAADLELRARLLASRELPSTQREAVKILEYMKSGALALAPSVERDYLLAQLYLSLGDWLKGSRQLAAVISGSKGKEAYPAYLSAYINALLDNYQAPTAQLWVTVLKSEKPKAIGTALLEARALLPKMRPGKDAVAPAWKLDEALKVLNQAIDDPEVKVGLPEDSPERQKLLKTAVVVRTLEALLPEAEENQPSTDYDTLRQAVDQYYAQVVAADETYYLVQVPYLVRQGRRPEALVLLQKHWEKSAIPTVIETVLTACGALLDTNAELGRVARLETPPDATGMAQLKIALADEAKETERILQQLLLKKQGELEKAEEAEKKFELSAEVTAIMLVLASHYVNSASYEQAVGLYTEILKRTNNRNIIALNNRAMILASLSKDRVVLEKALVEINQAIGLRGPLPMIVDSQAMILLASGKNPEALSAIQRVMGEKPDRLDPTVNKELAKQWGGYYFHLAWICKANGDTAGAAAAMKEAVKLGFGKDKDDVFKPELKAWEELEKSAGEKLSSRVMESVRQAA